MTTRAIRAEANAIIGASHDGASDADGDCDDDVLLNRNIGAEASGYCVVADTRCGFGPKPALFRRYN